MFTFYCKSIDFINFNLCILEFLIVENLTICPRVKNYVEGQIAASLAQGTLGESNNDTVDAVGDLIEQIRVREAYDDEYIANKTLEFQTFSEELIALQEERINQVMEDIGYSY